jgi:hypothetical protein
MKEGSQDNLDEVLTLSDPEIRFWDDVNINPYYMYLENTTKLVDMEYVNKNMNIMNSLDHQKT